MVTAITATMQTEKSVTDVYEFEEIIGEGSFSSVVLATNNETKKQYAIKIIDKSKVIDEIQRDRIDREIEILKRCKHPNIIKFIEAFESDAEISLVLELMQGGDLFDRITSRGFFKEEDARHAMNSIMSAVDYLHERSIVHRDLKPENLLYDSKDEDATLKIADFGLSKYSNETDGLETPCGTLAYTAPEVTNRKVYRKAVDIWSCGCIMYFMLFGKPPFYSDDEEEIYELVSEGTWTFPDKPRVSDSARELIGYLMEKDPNKRYTAKQALTHPWMTSSGHVFAVPMAVPIPTNMGMAMTMGIAMGMGMGMAMAMPIPNLRSSLHSAIDALRGPLTPPLASPLDSPLWKKRQRSRAKLIALQNSNIHNGNSVVKRSTSNVDMNNISNEHNSSSEDDMDMMT